MGFITSGSTLHISAYLTQKGRELLLTNKNDFRITYFAFGDSDTNYNVIEHLDSGHVPDVSGDASDCIKSIASNIEIKNKIIK